MRTIIFASLLLVFSTGTEAFELTSILHPSLNNAQAKYVHHRRRPHHRSTVYEPDRSRPPATNDEDKWTYRTEGTLYPYATGTSVLDQYSGRVPVIAAGVCVYADVDWLQREVNSIVGHREKSLSKLQ